jgi:hypothetical protein
MEESQSDQEGTWTRGWTIFSTPREEVMELFAPLGEVVINSDSIIFEQYPFQPSIVFNKATIAASDMIDIDIDAAPPSVRVGDELIFVSAMQRDELRSYAIAHQIPLVKRENVWYWLLEPFLDTEYTSENHRRLNEWLARYGLSAENVMSIREEVRIQMLKYNFDTMLWEWGFLGLLDVLSAMRPKYDTEQFADFYRRAMEIALLPDKFPPHA